MMYVLTIDHIDFQLHVIMVKKILTRLMIER